MKKYFSFFFILLCTNAFSQVQRDLAYLEELYIESSKILNAYYKGKEVKLFEAEYILDTLIAESWKKSPIRKINSNYEVYYNINPAFQKLINDINKIPQTQEGFLENKGKILDCVLSLKLPERIYASQYFVWKFWKLENEQTLAELEKIYNEGVRVENFDTLNVAQKCEFFRAAAHCASEVNENNKALELYYMAKYFLDSLNDKHNIASIHYNIGELYSKMQLLVCRQKAIEHYRRSADIFRSADREFNAMISDFEAASLIIWNKKPISLMDVMIVGEKLKREFPLKELSKRTESYLDSSDNYFVLSTIYNGISKFKSQMYWFKGFSILGQYFAKKEKWKEAEIYFRGALIKVLQYDSLNVHDIIDGLNQLAYVYLKTKKPVKALDYLTKAIEIASFHGIYEKKVEMLFKKADFLWEIGRYEDGVIECKNAMSDSKELPGFLYKDLVFRNVECLNRLYHAMGNTDSAKHYNTLTNGLILGLYQEFEGLARNETFYEEWLSGESYNKLSRTYNRLVSDIRTLNEKIKKLEVSEVTLLTSISQAADSLNSLNQEYSNQRSLSDSLVLHNSSLQKEGDSLSAEVKDKGEQLGNALIKNKKIGNRLSLIIKGGIALFLFLVIGGGFIFIRNQSTRNRLRQSLTKADADTRTLSHNIKDDYSDFLKIIESKDFGRAELFSLKTATYLGLATNKYDFEKNWTIAKEMELFDSFFEVRKLITPQIKYRKDFSGFDENRTVFVSDVFTTLFHNSLKHGKNIQLFFQINIRKEQDLLYVEIEDNGEPSEPGSYIRADRPKKGLSLLKTKIEAIAKLNRATRNIRNPFIIEPKINNGTTIKFVFPFKETSKNIFA